MGARFFGLVLRLSRPSAPVNLVMQRRTLIGIAARVELSASHAPGATTLNGLRVLSRPGSARKLHVDVECRGPHAAGVLDLHPHPVMPGLRKGVWNRQVAVAAQRMSCVNWLRRRAVLVESL